MKFRRKPHEVEAMRVPVFEEGMTAKTYEDEFEKVEEFSGGVANWSRVRPISITINERVARGTDWIVREADDSIEIWNDQSFRMFFEPIEEVPEGDPYLWESGT